MFGLLLALGVSTVGRSHAQTKADAPKVAGTWVWTWKDPLGQTHRHVLEVEGVGTKVAARELFDDQPAVRASNLSLNGTAIKFTVVRDARRADYSGKVADDDHINGTVTVTTNGEAEEFVWKAERRKDAPK